MEGLGVQKLHILLGVDNVGMVEGKLLHITELHGGTSLLLKRA